MSEFVIENGILAAYTGASEEVIIPEGVTVIGSDPRKGAFEYNKAIRKVVIPEGVTTIGKRTFYYCENLESVKLPGTLTQIDMAAFANCKKLKYIHLPDSVTTLGTNVFAFSGLKGVVLSNHLTVIPEKAFYSCDALKNVSIPDGVKEIQYTAFSYSGLTSLEMPDSVETLGDAVFDGCKELATVTLSKNLTRLGMSQFDGCEKLQKIVLPAGIERIEMRAFQRCYNLTEVEIPDTVKEISYRAFCLCKKLAKVVLPEGVTTIGEEAFASCASMKALTIPDSLTTIDKNALNGCKGLKKLYIANSPVKIGMVFGNQFPTGLVPQIPELLPRMTDAAVKQYVLDKKIWNGLTKEVQADVFFSKQGKSLHKTYTTCITGDQLVTMADLLAQKLGKKPSAKDCNTVANFMLLFAAKAPADSLKKLHEALKPHKTAAKALASIEADITLMKALGNEAKIDENLPAAEKAVIRLLGEQQQSAKDLEGTFKSYYGLTAADIFPVNYTDGTKAAPVVLMWLLTTHEKLQTYSYGQPDVDVAYDQPGIRPEAAEILAMLDNAGFMDCLRRMANLNLGLTGRSKRMFLAYPICRYADETLMAELCAMAPKWRSTVSGNNAPSLLTFRDANKYSNARAAMLFADKYKELEAYARLRGTTADAIRDQLLSDVGLDEKGGKSYNLGNQVVIARLQSDLSFLIELPTGKTAKSLPKKGADEALYAAANADFSEMKKSVKKIVKNRATILFEDFLSGRARSAESWQESYLHNPLLRRVAKLLVWQQGDKTFTLNDTAVIRADGSEYTILKSKKIALAHPMDMDADERKAWQHYFIAHGLKQPFEQVWEPVVARDTIKPDRYKECMIPYYRFTGQTKRGIQVEDYDFHNEIVITINGCETDIERIHYRRHDISADDPFEIKKFTFKVFTRQVNHVVAYFDKITIYDRIRKDDVSIAELLPQFTLAQITEFLSIAQESSATNVIALLLEYKNANFADFDPMEEFSLDL